MDITYISTAVKVHVDDVYRRLNCHPVLTPFTSSAKPPLLPRSPIRGARGDHGRVADIGTTSTSRSGSLPRRRSWPLGYQIGAAEGAAAAAAGSERPRTVATATAAASGQPASLSARTAEVMKPRDRSGTGTK